MIGLHDARLHELWDATAERISELCRGFYQLGWVSGSGGGICVRPVPHDMPGLTADNFQDDDNWEKVRKLGIVVAPSGVHKERMRKEDFCVLDEYGNVLRAATPLPADPTCFATQWKLSECTPIFLAIMGHRRVNAVIHSHSPCMVYPRAEVKLSRFEMLKGFRAVGALCTVRVPVIPNTVAEADLVASIERALDEHSAAPGIIVQGHGVYIWGRDWSEAKRHAECLHYLLDLRQSAEPQFVEDALSTTTCITGPRTGVVPPFWGGGSQARNYLQSLGSHMNMGGDLMHAFDDRVIFRAVMQVQGRFAQLTDFVKGIAKV